MTDTQTKQTPYRSVEVTISDPLYQELESIASIQGRSPESILAELVVREFGGNKIERTVEGEGAQ